MFPFSVHKTYHITDNGLLGNHNLWLLVYSQYQPPRTLPHVLAGASHGIQALSWSAPS